jgi:hypothetical protein
MMTITIDRSFCDRGEQAEILAGLGLCLDMVKGLTGVAEDIPKAKEMLREGLKYTWLDEGTRQEIIQVLA